MYGRKPRMHFGCEHSEFILPPSHLFRLVMFFTRLDVKQCKVVKCGRLDGPKNASIMRII